MYLRKIITVIILIVLAVPSSSEQIVINQGSSIVLKLPGVECGKYTLLNGLLRPVLVIEKKAPKLLGTYVQRAKVTGNETGFNLTINDAGLQDDGTYKVASSKATCKDIEYFVTVKAISQAFLEQWGEWTSCEVDCDAKESRSRSRSCSINGGCLDIGQMSQTQTCEKADHCAHWSQWSGFGECSAKCGKGFKIRSRNCLKGSSSLLQTDDCKGLSIQSHMCMTVCEVVGVWTGWTDWSTCSPDCGETRYKNRTRLCNDPRDVPNCPGDYVEYEDCSPLTCNEFRNKTGNGTNGTNGTGLGYPITETEVANQTWLSQLNLVVMLVILGAITLIVLIVIFMIVRKRLEVKRVNSSRLSRDTQVENATIDKRLTKAAKRTSRPDGVNVYSELGASFCYNDSEFEDSDEDEEETADEPSGSKEESENKVNNALVGDGVATIDESIYDNNVVDVPSILRNLSDSSIYNDPPNEDNSINDIINPDEVISDSKDGDDANQGGNKEFEELTGLFVVPPVKKLSTGFNINKAKEDMYRKVNKNRVKPNKVEINHAHDVYYEPPEYREQEEPKVEIDKGAEVNYDDNIYENCEVANGQMEIVPSQVTNVHSKVSVTEKDEPVEFDSGMDSGKDNDISDNQNEMHPKMKEALLDTENMVFTYDNKVEEANDVNKKDVEHIYENDDIKADMQDYYVTPRYTSKLKHIYDVPKTPP